MAAGEYAEAIIEYRNARALDPTSGEARMKLAEAFMQAGDFGNALQEFVRAADLLPDDLPDARFLDELTRPATHTLNVAHSQPALIAHAERR